MKKSRLSILVVLLTLSVAGAFLWLHQSRNGKLPFNAQQWKQDKPMYVENSIRQRMLESLLSSGSLRNLDKEHVISLLGEPDEVRTITGIGSQELIYCIGLEDGWIQIDNHWLVLTLTENGTVANVVVRPD